MMSISQYLRIKWNDVFEVPSEEIGTQENCCCDYCASNFKCLLGTLLLSVFLFKPTNIYHSTATNMTGSTVLWEAEERSRKNHAWELIHEEFATSS
jgi:hypothetical protein